MSDNHPIVDGLEQARAAVRRAAHALETGADFDLREIETQVDLAAAATTKQARQPGDAAHVALINLVADLDGLQARLQKERKATADWLGRSAVNRRAFVAYGRGPVDR